MQICRFSFTIHTAGLFAFSTAFFSRMTGNGKFTVQLAQPNYKYGNNVFLPYSVGVIEAFARAQIDLSTLVDFCPSIFLREPIDAVVRRSSHVDLLGLSCYVWNWRYCLALSKAIKEARPICHIVLGGPQAPLDAARFLADHPWIDTIIPYEGEVAMANLLRRLLDLPVSSSSTPRIDDLSILPSPYLDGVFDSLMSDHPNLEWHACQETHRGCPYSCTFCDWGSAVFSKVRRFPTSRVLAEQDWFGQRKISLVYNCDANYGLFESDVEYARHLAATKARYGYPQKLRTNFAKSGPERIFEIGRILNDAGMCKGVTISLQSTNVQTLTAIKRKNLDRAKFQSLVASSKVDSLPAYTELILGLPLETRFSFIDGLSDLIEAGMHEGLFVYPAEIIDNSELADPAYRTRYGLVTRQNSIRLQHGDSDPTDIPESYEIVVSTSTMSIEDWRFCLLFATVVQAFHCLNLTREFAIAARLLGLSYRDFYLKLIDHFSRTTGPISSALDYLVQKIRLVSDGLSGICEKLEWYGNMLWPLEEWLFLHLLFCQSDWLPSVSQFAESLGVSSSIFLRQLQSTRHPQLESPPLSWPDFAREIVWYGRKGGKMSYLKTL